MKTVINSLDNFGRGIGKYNDKVVFIPYTLVGEEVEFEIVFEKKKFIEGSLIKVLNESEKRIKSNCPYFGLCGGCQISHLKSDYQLEFKKEKVKNIFNKYLKLDINPDIINVNFNNYRNKFYLLKEIIFNYNE